MQAARQYLPTANSMKKYLPKGLTAANKKNKRNNKPKTENQEYVEVEDELKKRLKSVYNSYKKSRTTVNTKKLRKNLTNTGSKFIDTTQQTYTRKKKRFWHLLVKAKPATTVAVAALAAPAAPLLSVTGAPVDTGAGTGVTQIAPPLRVNSRRVNTTSESKEEESKTEELIRPTSESKEESKEEELPRPRPALVLPPVSPPVLPKPVQPVSPANVLRMGGPRPLTASVNKQKAASAPVVPK